MQMTDKELKAISSLLEAVTDLMRDEDKKRRFLFCMGFKIVEDIDDKHSTVHEAGQMCNLPPENVLSFLESIVEGIKKGHEKKRIYSSGEITDLNKE